MADQMIGAAVTLPTGCPAASMPACDARESVGYTMHRPIATAQRRACTRARGTRPERAVGFEAGGSADGMKKPVKMTRRGFAVLGDAPARGREVACGGGEEVVVRVAGQAAVAGVGLHGRQDRGELLVGGHGVK